MTGLLSETEMDVNEKHLFYNGDSTSIQVFRYIARAGTPKSFMQLRKDAVSAKKRRQKKTGYKGIMRRIRIKTKINEGNLRQRQFYFYANPPLSLHS